MGDTAELSRTRAALLALLLGLLGAAANLVPLPIGLGVSFLLGPAFGLTAVLLLGTGWGALAALLAATSTWRLWNHANGFVVFGLEALWVGLFLRAGRRNAVLVDAAFWLLAGPPLCWLLLRLRLGTSAADAFTVLLKLGVNGVLLALLASAAVTHLPLAERLGVRDGPRRVSFAQLLFHLTAAALLVPAVCLLLYSSSRVSEAAERQLAELVRDEALESGLEIQEWTATQGRAVQAAAGLLHAREPRPAPMPSASRPDGVRTSDRGGQQLAEELREIRALFPALETLSLFDPGGRLIAAEPGTPDAAPAFGVAGPGGEGRAWDSPEPRLSGVLSRSGLRTRVIELAIPHFERGVLQGVAVGALRLESLQELLVRGTFHKELWSTILDGEGRVVATTQPQRRPLDAAPPPSGATPVLSDGSVSLLAPARMGRAGAFMNAWRDATYFARRPVTGTGWTLLIESPLAPVQDRLLRTARESLAGVAILLVLALAAAHRVSRALAELPARFALLSRDLPYRLGTHGAIAWPETPIEELAALIANFRQVTEALGRTMEGLRANEQLLVQQARHAAVGEALAAIAHQWRQPLNALGLVLQNLRDAFEHGELDRAYLDRALGKARLQLQHLSRTIDDFRSFSQPDRQTTTYPLCELFREVLALYQPQLDSSRVRVELTGCQEPAGPALVHGPRNAFGHAILNLLNNAREAILEQRTRLGLLPSGGPVQEPAVIQVLVRQEGDRVHVAIADEGGGIPAELFETLFEPYHSTKGPARGTGLGLYLCKRVVEEHMAGTIRATNGPAGAVFTIELPAARAEVRR